MRHAAAQAEGQAAERSAGGRGGDGAQRRRLPRVACCRCACHATLICALRLDSLVQEVHAMGLNTTVDTTAQVREVAGEREGQQPATLPCRESAARSRGWACAQHKWGGCLH